MAITISWSSEITVQNSTELRKVGVWYVDGVETGTVSICVDSDGNPVISDEDLITKLDWQNTFNNGNS